MSDAPKSDVALPTAPDADAPKKQCTHPIVPLKMQFNRNLDDASCHCGAFTYTVTASPPLDDPKTEVMRPFLPQTPKIQQHHTDSSTECNCSICTRNGYLFIYTPNAAISFTKGEFSDLTEYRFGPKPKVAHYFCGTCGSSCVARSIGTFISTFVWGRGAMW
jgi:hypothetical protein